jgi:hypothetical protein
MNRRECEMCGRDMTKFSSQDNKCIFMCPCCGSLYLPSNTRNNRVRSYEYSIGTFVPDGDMPTYKQASYLRILAEQLNLDIDIYSSVIDSVITELEEMNFNVTRNSNEIKATKRIENIFELSNWDSLIKEVDGDIFSVNKKQFTKEYILNGKIDLTGYSSTNKEMKLDEELKSLLDITFNLTLPSKAIDSNATKINGRNLVWNLEYGEVNFINVNYSLINVETLLLSGVATIVLLGILIFLIKFNKKKLND